MKTTDFHAHAFPDALAERAIRTLEAETDKVKARLDGRISSLLASLDRAGIDRCVVCSIATRPEQFDPILAWSRKIASDRIIPLPSFHPRDPDALGKIERIRAAGFRGIKLHPYYQDFYLDEEPMIPLYDRIAELGLMLVAHTGFDIAFPRIRRCDPARIVNVLRQTPELKLVATHMGGWEDWDSVRTHLLGKPVYMEISYTLEMLSGAEAKAMLLAHSADHLLFGTDSPWQDHCEALQRLRALELGENLERKIMSENAARLLDG